MSTWRAMCFFFSGRLLPGAGKYGSVFRHCEET